MRNRSVEIWKLEIFYNARDGEKEILSHPLVGKTDLILLLFEAWCMDYIQVYTIPKGKSYRSLRARQ